MGDWWFDESPWPGPPHRGPIDDIIAFREAIESGTVHIGTAGHSFLESYARQAGKSKALLELAEKAADHMADAFVILGKIKTGSPGFSSDHKPVTPIWVGDTNVQHGPPKKRRWDRKGRKT